MRSNFIYACYLGVLLYFAAGLLPDVDGPFQPIRPNWYSWIVAISFEATIVSLRTRKSSHIEDLGKVQFVEVFLGPLRLGTLLVMCIVFIVLVSFEWSPNQLSADENDSLLENGVVGSAYGSTASSKPYNQDSESTGWLNYFIGFGTLFPYIWPSNSKKQQVVLILCLVLLICQRVVNILVPYQLGVVVGNLGNGRVPFKEISLYCLYRGLQGQQGVIGSVRSILWIPIGQSLYQRLTSAAFEHVLLLSFDFHLSKRIGEVMSALSKGGSLNTFLDGFAFQLFPMVLDLGVAAVYLFFNFDAFYSIIVIAVMWSYIYVTIYMARYRGYARREMAKRDREMDAAKTDAIIAYETVHHNCAVPSEIAKFRFLVSKFQKAEFSVLLSLHGLNAIQNFIFIVGVILVAMLSAYQISQGQHQIPDFVTLITYFAQLQAPLAFFGSFYNQAQNNLVEAERMLELFKQKPDIVDSPNSKSLTSCKGRICFKNVTFAYNSRKPAIKDVSFTVEPGTTTAIVGESGSGKSTILKLLFRFYDIGSGSITIDDSDLRSLKLQSVREHIGVVPQDTVLFNETLLYNVLYGRQNATETELFEACHAASIHQKIVGFPDGYNTAVGERGLKLSGGEKQRVAIARAILKKPQIMLLDEATSSLDSHTERQIQEALEQVTKNRTTITIAHRLSTITEADQILVLHEGRIVERGRHVDLLKLGGRYRTMWEKQTIAGKEKFNSVG